MRSVSCSDVYPARNSEPEYTTSVSPLTYTSSNGSGPGSPLSQTRFLSSSLNSVGKSLVA